MKKVIVFGGSTSSTSINKELATYVASQLLDVNTEIIDMRMQTAPLYSVDLEKEGFPDNMIQLQKLFESADGFVISLAEHNGSYASAYKNTIDWLSRIKRDFFGDKPMILISSSPGARGGATVLESATTYYPRLGAKIVSSFPFPDFYDNYKDGEVVNKELQNKINHAVKLFQKQL